MGLGDLGNRKATGQVGGVSHSTAVSLMNRECARSGTERMKPTNSTACIGVATDPSRSVGAMVEVRVDATESIQTEQFRSLADSIALHIAGLNPKVISEHELPEQLLESERNRLIGSFTGPKHAQDQFRSAVDDHIRREHCLLHQPYLLDDEVTVAELLIAEGERIGGKVSVVRFVRYQTGES